MHLPLLIQCLRTTPLRFERAETSARRLPDAAVISERVEKAPTCCQKPYVRIVKMFVNGKPTFASYRLNNAGPATAICIVLQDRYGHAVDLRSRLAQL